MSNKEEKFTTLIPVFKNNNDKQGYNIDLFEIKNEKLMKNYLCPICFNVWNEPYEFHCDKNHFQRHW